MAQIASLILGAIDLIAGIVLFMLDDIAKYIGLILIWKGFITLFYYFKLRKGESEYHG